MRLLPFLALAVPLLGGPHQARAQEAPAAPRIDADDPCMHEGLPAVSPGGRLVAWVSCWTDLSAALDARFVVADASTGAVLSEVVLARRPTGGDGGTRPRVVRRRVGRANRSLVLGRFTPMLPVEELTRGTTEAAVADVVLRFDADRRLLLVRDASSGAERGRASLPDHPCNPYCCGGEPTDHTACNLPPEPHGVWRDEGMTVVVAEVTSGSVAPDGCEGGPEFVIVAVRPAS